MPYDTVLDIVKNRITHSAKELESYYPKRTFSKINIYMKYPECRIDRDTNVMLCKSDEEGIEKRAYFKQFRRTPLIDSVYMAQFPESAVKDPKKLKNILKDDRCLYIDKNLIQCTQNDITFRADEPAYKIEAQFKPVKEFLPK